MNYKKQQVSEVRLTPENRTGGFWVGDRANLTNAVISIGFTGRQMPSSSHATAMQLKSDDFTDKNTLISKGKLVGAKGFEPSTPRSRTVCATGLRYAPNMT